MPWYYTILQNYSSYLKTLKSSLIFKYTSYSNKQTYHSYQVKKNVHWSNQKGRVIELDCIQSQGEKTGTWKGQKYYSFFNIHTKTDIQDICGIPILRKEIKKKFWNGSGNGS